MIKKLQRKLILLSMTAFLLVLVVIMTGINTANWNAVVRDADRLLEILSENRGGFPDGPGHRLPPGMSPETPYESRFFTVTLESSGSLVKTDTSRIASVDGETAMKYASEVMEKGCNRGFLRHFRYFIRTEDGILRITFLDCRRDLESFFSFLGASVGISLAGYLVVFVLIVFFSGRIIRPISESYEKQKRFITDAGHEIKTPLTIIRADADVLAMEQGENEWLEDIQKQAKHLTDLANDLVTLSRMEEGEQIIQMIEFPFSDVVGEAASSFQARAQTVDKELRLEIQPMLTLRGNEKTIRQLVNILLDNALKYSPENSSVWLKVWKQGKYLCLSVTNTTAQTIGKESLPLLFDRFYRTDASRNSQTGGFGIGLSLAKAIVTAHGGKIQATAPDGQSLTFTVRLPGV